MGLLGWALAAAFLAAIVIVIHGMITEEKIRQELKDRCLDNAFVKKIDACENTITLEEFESGRKIEIQGDSISDDIYEDDVIYVF